ncbi:hypothetical protein WH50_20825 [Pokkaliibacter plantistimulans]|uniref:PhoD-like phosphatase metallophosphatase domain-containing protein n=2 Tax=Pokkaliibacter plantistimulans TaxID=1635171 RepID=A0ABX5LWA6_9GAMM|nr:hypothetical protein WH50_20825 [Pokkaliibacter plantistimulans]
MLHPVSVGPIVGHTTASSARIWARAHDNADAARTIGVAALFEGDKGVQGSTRYFRLQREYDRTGTTDFVGLQPGTRYTVRLASLALDHVDPMETSSLEEITQKLPAADAWLDELGGMPEEHCQASFTTFPVQSGDFSFIFGSCRYPETLWGKKQSDAIFEAIYKRCHDEDSKEKLAEADKARFVLMIGDQIYADLLNRHIPIARADTEEEFRSRYVDAFTTRNMSTLLSSTPTYMILDDHEVEDNWSFSRIKKDPDKRNLFFTAMMFYRSYQWLHSPTTEYGSDALYYHFNYGQYPFFVLDARSKRLRHEESTVDQLFSIGRFKDWGEAIRKEHHLLGKPKKNPNEDYRSQLDDFCQWLINTQLAVGNLPKFVVSSSVFSPNTVESAKDDYGKFKDDAWAAFPTTRAQVLRTIVENGVQNVVFLTGDVHCSNCASMTLERPDGSKLPLKLYDITSSAFYWPFSFADGEPEEFVHDSKTEEYPDPFIFETSQGPITLHYTAGYFCQEDNFTQVNVTASGLRVRYFDKKGKSLSEVDLPLS